VLNFFNTIGGKVVNFGGITSGRPAIAITLISDTQIQFAVPRGAVAGAAYVQAINPPFVPFSSSGNGAGGAFRLVNPLTTATATPTNTPAAPPTPIVPTPIMTKTPTATPSATPALTPAVLLAGGENDSVLPSGEHPTLTSAELYDEATGIFSATASMTYSRFGSTMTGLENGGILIAGGYDGFSKRPLATAELYDAKTASFSLTGTMNTARLGHTAILLNSGRVFLAGGCNVDFTVTDIAEFYDPATGYFTPVASLVDARTGHTATLLKDGQVLIAGGADDFGITSSAELCDEDDYGGCQPVFDDNRASIRHGHAAG
jgi:hypothetical protein